MIEAVYDVFLDTELYISLPGEAEYAEARRQHRKVSFTKRFALETPWWSRAAPNSIARAGGLDRHGTLRNTIMILLASTRSLPSLDDGWLTAVKDSGEYVMHSNLHSTCNRFFIFYLTQVFPYILRSNIVHKYSSCTLFLHLVLCLQHKVPDQSRPQLAATGHGKTATCVLSRGLAR